MESKSQHSLGSVKVHATAQALPFFCLFVCFTDDATNSYSYVYTVKIMGFGDNCVPQ